MEEVSDALSSTVRWGTPAVGPLIMLIAWKRFKLTAVRLALGGYALMLVSQITRAIPSLLLNRGSDFTITRYNLIFIAAGFVSFIGTVVIVLAMRKLITAAEVAGLDALEVGDRE